MTQTTPHAHKSSPFRLKTYTRRLYSPSKPSNRSSLWHKPNSGDRPRRNILRPRNYTSTQYPRANRKLRTIREEVLSPDHRRSRPNNTFNGYQTLSRDETDEESQDNDDNANLEDSFFHWEEETTLFSDLMEESPGEAPDHKLDSLANSLQDSFDISGKELKKEIAETLVPTVNSVKELYQTLDEQVDISFGRGLLGFNSACKEMEVMAMKDLDDLQHSYTRAKENIDNLLAQLKEAYAHRDQLWVDFEKAFDDIAKPALETVKSMPAKIERTIANLEKQVKLLEKDDGGSATITQKTLKGLLGKI